MTPRIVTQLGFEQDKRIVAGRLIQTIAFEQRRLLVDILELHADGAETFELDPCYGFGGFYTDLPEPPLRFDIDPKFPFISTADVLRLPLAAGSVSSAIFDPPFIAGNSAGGGIMGDRFGFFPTLEEMYSFFGAGLAELGRVISRYGLLVVKCQDLIFGRSNYPILPVVYHLALAAGFYPRDVFVLVNEHLPTRANMREQNHARKAHTYFVVFTRSDKRSRYFREKLPYEYRRSAPAALPNET
jgi:hypothetical protein